MGAASAGGTGAFSRKQRAFHALPSASRRVPTSDACLEKLPAPGWTDCCFPAARGEFLCERLGGGTLTRSVRAES